MSGTYQKYRKVRRDIVIHPNSVEVLLRFINHYVVLNIFNVLLGTSWYCEISSYVVALYKWESKRITWNITTAFTTGLYRNAEGSHWQASVGTQKGARGEDFPTDLYLLVKGVPRLKPRGTPFDGKDMTIIEEVMAEIKTYTTMEEFVTKDRANYYSGITSITINGKAAYELKGKLLDDLRDNAFSETKGEDAVKHI
ncbi:hypothetical protein Tco_0300899 [Tanacetum coccineum]